jgi:hypothetical protein
LDLIVALVLLTTTCIAQSSFGSPVESRGLAKRQLSVDPETRTGLRDALIWEYKDAAWQQSDDDLEEDDYEYGNSSTRAVRAAVLQAPPAAKRPPSKRWTFSLTPYKVLPNKLDTRWKRYYHVTPDCFLPVIPKSTRRGWIQFWSESSNYRTTSSTGPFFENAQVLDPFNMVFGGAYSGKGYDNGGKWLMSVFRHPVKGGANLVGFYHAQDNFGDPLTGSAAAWKSIGVAYSTNDGVSWRNGGIIVTSWKNRPPNSRPEFGGNGDFGCVWDYKSRRWIMYYAGDYYLGIAVSSDPDGKRGTFFKYAGPGRGFTHPGIRGRGFGAGVPQLPDGSQDWSKPVRGLAMRPGSNPAIHFNVYLNKWVMLWNGWDNRMYISASEDVADPDGWETPRLVARSVDGTKAWHPTVVCQGGGSAWCPTNTGKLYYADRWRAPDLRDFVTRTITFRRRD